MNKKKDEKWLDELISRTINTTKPEFDVEKWKQKYPEEFQMLLSRAAKGASVRRPNMLKVILKRPITKLAAAAVLLIGLGYIAGQFSAPPPDMKQLHADLETSLKSSLAEEMNRRWQPVFAASCVQLKDELHQQVRRDLAEFADQILTASGTLTEQRLMELINLIEAARMRDRRQVAAALEKIEFSRLQDKSQLGSGLVTLAARTDELLGTKEN